MDRKLTDSGRLITVKVPSDKPGVTDVTVDPGTKVHNVVIRGDTMEPDTAQPVPEEEKERRRTPPVNLQVQNQPMTPGLPGIWGIVSQLGAFGFVLLLTYFMWMTIRETMTDNKALIREEIRAIKDEIRQSRESDDRRDAAFLTTMNSMTSKNDAVALQFAAGMSEVRAWKLSMEEKLDRILNVFLKPKEMSEILGYLQPSLAPAPRLKGG